MASDLEDLVSMHGRSLSALERVADLVDADDLERSTPCGDWNVRALTEHIVGQTLGLAHAAAGGGPDLEAWQPRRLDLGVGDSVRRCDDTIRSALRRPVDPVWMPEVVPDRQLPLRSVVGFHLVDTVVHGWDLAVSVDAVISLDDDIVAAALAIAVAVPDGDNRDQPGSAFSRSLPADGAEGLDRILAVLGRDPHWRPA